MIMDTKAIINVAQVLSEHLKDYDVQEKFNINLDSIQDRHALEVIARLASYITYLGNTIEVQDNILLNEDLENLVSHLMTLKSDSEQVLESVDRKSVV